MRAKQLSFLPRSEPEHGGNLSRGRRKTARPIDPKRPIHIVLRSSRARSAWSMLQPKNERSIREVLKTAAGKYDVRVYRFANVGNHLHLLVMTRTRRAFQGFLRELSGRIAAAVTGSRKTHPIGGRFWDFLAYTRIVSWGRDFKNLQIYFIKNLFEAAGLYPRRAKELDLRIVNISAWAAAPPG